MPRTSKIVATGLAASALLVSLGGSAGAADDTTVVSVSLTAAAGTLSITAPTGTAATPVSLGTVPIGATVGQALTNPLGTITVQDTTTGLLQAATVSTASTLSTASASLCQDDDGVVTSGVVCSSDTNKLIPLANLVYTPGTVTTGGSSTGTAVATPGALGTAKVVFTQATPGDYTFSWNPTFALTLTGAEYVGTYYGSVQHSVTAAGL